MNTVIISGANGGLGKSIVERFLEGGWRVYALCKRKDSAKALAREFVRFTGTVNVMVCDLASTVSTHHFLTRSELQSVDAVIHTAGGIEAGKPIEETTPEMVQAMLEINYVTAFNLLRVTVPLLKVRGGAIVTIGAQAAIKPESNKSAYAASKAALIALTQATAHEGKQHSISANCIVPSIIDTPSNREWGAPEDITKWVTPATIADAAWMLCTAAGRGISGAVLPMRGMM
jgi:NAD(P)-dependent dehydrogenase (short-subunit alcohol dehydrogenase family)